MDEQDVECGISGRTIVAFVGMAILLGPIASYTCASFEAAVQWQVLAGRAVVYPLAGCGLLVLGRLRGERLANGKLWLAAGVLMVVQVLDEMLRAGTLWLSLHETSWGVALIVAVAAPLWLCLLSALGMFGLELPRAVGGAGIAGVGAVLLVIPTEAYEIGPNQAPMLLVRLLLGIATVFAWWFARQRLTATEVLTGAGLFLLMSACMDTMVFAVVEPTGRLTVEWHDAVVPLLLKAGFVAASSWLWLYLLVRMRLTAFSMHPLAVWAATLASELATARLAAWRMDLAVVIAIGAIAVGLRARLADEQPTALGLRGV